MRVEETGRALLGQQRRSRPSLPPQGPSARVASTFRLYHEPTDRESLEVPHQLDEETR